MTDNEVGKVWRNAKFNWSQYEDECEFTTLQLIRKLVDERTDYYIAQRVARGGSLSRVQNFRRRALLALEIPEIEFNDMEKHGEILGSARGITL